MKIFHKYGPCRGMTLFRWKNFNIEIWFCPSYYQIPEHKHPNEHIELMFVYGGDTLFVRRESLKSPNETLAVRFPQDIFKKFTVKPNHYHWFSVSKHPLIFLNISHWINNVKPTSAAYDFELAVKD